MTSKIISRYTSGATCRMGCGGVSHSKTVSRLPTSKWQTQGMCGLTVRGTMRTTPWGPYLHDAWFWWQESCQGNTTTTFWERSSCNYPGAHPRALAVGNAENGASS